MDQPKFSNERAGYVEARFEAIAQTATDAIVIADENSLIVFANKKTYEIFEYQEGTLLGLNLTALMPEKYRKAHSAGMQRFMDSGVAKLIGHTIEIEGLKKDGAVFPLELSLSSWQEHKEYFFSGIIRDISKRKEQEKALHDANMELAATLEELQSAEDQLRKTNEELERRVKARTDALATSEEQLRMITDALPVLISYVNANEVYTFVNNTYTTWFGKQKEEIINKPVREIIGEEAYNTTRACIQKALKGEEVHFETYMPYQFSEPRHTILNLIPHGSEGKIAGFFTLVTDVTQLRKAQTALSKKNNELIRINTDLDNFIYTASHDLKSPIANMEGLLQMIEHSLRDKLQEREQKMFAMIDISVGKLKNTIGCLSDVTKIAKNLDQQTELISIARIVEDIKLDINHLIEAAKPVFKEEYKVEQVELPRANFRSIAYNLISNAIKYRSPQRSLVIEINTFAEEEYTVFSVKDNGLGLLPQQQNKLFTMFKRLHSHVEGTGIGLYIVKRIVENIGGRVIVESSLEEGTTFSVYFPKGEDIRAMSHEIN